MRIKRLISLTLIGFFLWAFGYVLGQRETKHNFHGVALTADYLKEGVEYKITPLKYNYIEIETSEEGPRIVTLKEDVVEWLSDFTSNVVNTTVDGRYLSVALREYTSFYNYRD